MARITIIGGHGRVALRLSRILSQQGHEVTSWIRSAGQAFHVRETGARPIMMSVEALTAGTMAVLLEGEDAVVWSAGAGGGDPDRTRAVDQDGAIRMMEAAGIAGVPRFVMVSWFYDHAGHGVSPEIPFWHYAEAKANADAHLRGTDLDWTILGPSSLTEERGTGLIEINGERSEVSRDDVARVAAEVLERPGTIGRVINFSGGSTPIAEALDALA